MCQEAGIHGKKANHSLRATGATILFNAQVPEKMIKEITGHRSLKDLPWHKAGCVKGDGWRCWILIL